MCGNRRRAARCGGGVYGAGYHSVRPMNGPRTIMAVIDGLQQLSVASQQQEHQYQYPQRQIPAVVMPRAAELDTQTQGVIYPTSDEKKLQPTREDVDFEILPTYEESTATPKPRATVAETLPVESIEAVYKPQDTTLPRQNNQTLASSGLNAFNSALSSYRAGGRHGKRHAKRAARDFINELANQERARMEATYGPLVCGQRKQIRKDLKPVKAMLKDAVKEIRSERV